MVFSIKTKVLEELGSKFKSQIRERVFESFTAAVGQNEWERSQRGNGSQRHAYLIGEGAEQGSCFQTDPLPPPCDSKDAQDLAHPLASTRRPIPDPGSHWLTSQTLRSQPIALDLEWHCLEVSVQILIPSSTPGPEGATLRNLGPTRPQVRVKNDFDVKISAPI